MKRHPIDPFSLVAGLVVTGIAIAALARPWRFEIGPWAGPTLLIVAGVVILGLVVAGSRDADDAPIGALVDDPSSGADDPERRDAIAAAYAELDDDVTAVLDEDTATVDDDDGVTADTTPLRGAAGGD